MKSKILKLKISNHLKQKLPFDKGFSFIEVLVSIFILVIAITASFSVLQGILSYNVTNSSRLVAAYLAQEGIEIVRNIRDGNWLESRTNSVTSWDEGLTGCGGNGCRADYNHSYSPLDREDPTLPDYPVEGQFLNIDSSGFYGYGSSPTTTKFQRKIVITQGAINELKVNVTVSWQEKGSSNTLSALENLYNWK